MAQILFFANFVLFCLIFAIERGIGALLKAIDVLFNLSANLPATTIDVLFNLSANLPTTTRSQDIYFVYISRSTTITHFADF